MTLDEQNTPIQNLPQVSPADGASSQQVTNVAQPEVEAAPLVSETPEAVAEAEAQESAAQVDQIPSEKPEPAPTPRYTLPPHIIESQKRRARELAEREAARKKQSRQRLIIGIAAAVVAIYLGGFAYFSSHFMPRASFGDTPLAGMTADEAYALVQQHTSEYGLSLSGHGLDAHIAGADIELGLGGDSTPAQLIGTQTPFAWPATIFMEHNVADVLTLSYNKEQLEARVRGAISDHNASAQPTKNAGIGFNAETNRIEYQPAQLGDQFDAEAVLPKAFTAVETMMPSLELGDESLIQPEDKHDEAQLKVAAEQANQLCDFEVTFMIGGTAPFVVDAKDAIQWVAIDESYNVSFDDAAFQSWLEGIADLLNCVGGSRTYTRPDGKVVSVSGGQYGWKADRDVVISTLRDGITNRATEPVSVPVEKQGNGFLGVPGADWGKRFIDVDISEQYARFYNENGELVWETDVITGLDDGNFDTPCGVWTIEYKASPMSLRSVGDYIIYNDDGTTTVEHNHVYWRDVDYWMPFINDFIGLHDAWWQDDFGGELYHDAAHGSGGCVNLPPDKAGELYDMIQAGDVVVTHF